MNLPELNKARFIPVLFFPNKYQISLYHKLFKKQSSYFHFRCLAQLYPGNQVFIMELTPHLVSSPKNPEVFSISCSKLCLSLKVKKNCDNLINRDQYKELELKCDEQFFFPSETSPFSEETISLFTVEHRWNKKSQCAKCA